MKDGNGMKHLQIVMYLVVEFFETLNTFLCLQTRNISAEKRSLFSEVIHLIKIT